MVHFTEDGGEQPAIPPVEGLAPVIPLFGAQRHHTTWHSSWIDDDGSAPIPDESAVSTAEADAEAAAEKQLLRKLRTRSLSVHEARRALAQHDIDSAAVERIIEDFLHLGYLDDGALAEQLVHIGLDRKGQGRQVIAQSLSARGIGRDVADAALQALPDDEADRALEFARSRAGRLGDVDDTTALRRLLGQLARRGYGGSAATQAARTALAERHGSSSVRFR